MMLDFYRRDPYLAFPKHLGLVPADATKTSHGSLRDTYKVGLLACQHGQGPKGLAARLGISEFAAHEMHVQHRELFSTYWAWANDWLAHGLDTGMMRTPLDWAMVTGETEFNERSIINWPVQSSGADILRIAVVWATRKGLRLLAPIHDALLIESALDRIDHDVALLQELMRRASRIVLNRTPGGTIELRTDATIVRYPDRYRRRARRRGVEHVLELLAEQHRDGRSGHGGRTLLRAAAARARSRSTAEAEEARAIRQGAAVVDRSSSQGHPHPVNHRLHGVTVRVVES